MRPLRFVKWVVVGLQGSQWSAVERIRVARGCPRAVLLRELIAIGLRSVDKLTAKAEESIEKRLDAVEARVKALETRPSTGPLSDTITAPVGFVSHPAATKVIS